MLNYLIPCYSIGNNLTILVFCVPAYKPVVAEAIPRLHMNALRFRCFHCFVLEWFVTRLLPFNEIFSLFNVGTYLSSSSRRQNFLWTTSTYMWGAQKAISLLCKYYHRERLHSTPMNGKTCLRLRVFPFRISQKIAIKRCDLWAVYPAGMVHKLECTIA